MEGRLRNESEARFVGIQERLEDIQNRTEARFRTIENKLRGIEREQADTLQHLQNATTEDLANLRGIKREQADTKHIVVTTANRTQLSLRNMEDRLMVVEDKQAIISRQLPRIQEDLHTLKGNIQHLQNTTTQDLANLNNGLQTAQECMVEVKNKQSDITQDLMEVKTDIIAEITSTDQNGNCIQLLQRAVDNLTSTITEEFNLLEEKISSVGEATLRLLGGWTKVAGLDMRDPTHQCPPGLTERTEEGKRECGRHSRGPRRGCVSINYATHNIEYSKVCWKVIGYHFGYPRAFLAYYYNRNLTLEDAYVDGVSITHGNPRQHIWTLSGTWGESAGHRFACPCTQSNQYPNYSGAIPPFIEDHYFCDTGWLLGEPHLGAALFSTHPLWDGKDCGIGSCCTFNFPPWFCRELPEPTTDDIELRVCRSFPIVDIDTPIEQIELYVH